MISQIDRNRTGARIKYIMDNKGVTVKDVAEYFNFASVQSVYHWIEGKSLPTLDNIYALSEMLSVPVDELLVGDRLVKYNFSKNEYISRISSYYEYLIKNIA
ncbi:Helix-turn-helix domain-containing protein [Butyrivibrio hungatei DSM 14810]|uniref:Helix-turn-helix domain-containing protein n=1 Tax=Butyrivibrio hungatei DSM 14810 TaxID=1121132 RepID=A0A1M7SEC3_9FIRM|nr:helix-turn-helix transcriptional regulator [Butyrivibrio hungatei]SHN56839.1 Helix-turn-helix domain-containing protein [Butyrivibrio hungatei DSM 14810]